MSGRAMEQRNERHSDAVANVLASPGRPLETTTRQSMESRFGRDFSNVRVHADSDAAVASRSVGARAFTVGNHIAFGAGNYVPSSRRGTQLLAHELTHTVQQAGTPGTLMRAPEGDKQPTSEPEKQADDTANKVLTGKPAKGTFAQDKCGRKDTTTLPGFDNTTKGPHIKHIDVDIKTNAYTDITLWWANLPSTLAVPPPVRLHGSPGAGLCSKDCSDPKDANTKDSLCTPLGNMTILGYACQLPTEAKAKFVSWLNTTRGIAFHYYDVPEYPASHGCVRMMQSQRGAEWIYDNSIAGVTSVTMSRPAGDPGPMCWKGALTKRPGYVAPAPPAEEKQQAPEPGGEAPHNGDGP